MLAEPLPSERRDSKPRRVPFDIYDLSGYGFPMSRDYVLQQGIPPERILLLTFTNKAAREMMRRVADLLGQELPSLWGGTFHSIGNRVLRLHANLLGYERDFSIIDRE